MLDVPRCSIQQVSSLREISTIRLSCLVDSFPFRKTPSSRRRTTSVEEDERGKVYIQRRSIELYRGVSNEDPHPFCQPAELHREGEKVTREFRRKEWRMHRSFHELTSGIPVWRAAGFEIRSHASVTRFCKRNAVVLRSARRWRYHHAANLKFSRINSAATVFIYLLSGAAPRWIEFPTVR